MSLEEQLSKAEQELQDLEAGQRTVKDQEQALVDRTEFLAGFIKSLRYEVEYKKSEDAISKSADARKDLESAQADLAGVVASANELANSIRGKSDSIQSTKNEILLRDRLLIRHEVLEKRLRYHQLLSQVEELGKAMNEQEKEYEHHNSAVIALGISMDRSLIMPTAWTHETAIAWALEEMETTENELGDLGFN